MWKFVRPCQAPLISFSLLTLNAACVNNGTFAFETRKAAHYAYFLQEKNSNNATRVAWRFFSRSFAGGNV